MKKKKSELIYIQDICDLPYVSTSEELIARAEELKEKGWKK